MTDNLETQNNLITLVNNSLKPMVIFAAFDVDLFPLLINNKMSVWEISHQLNLNNTTVKVMMECLASIGILEQESDNFCLALEYNNLFLDKYQQIKQTVDTTFKIARKWLDIANVAKGVSIHNQPEKHMLATGEGLEEYLIGVRNFNHQHTVELANFLTNVISSRKYKSLMDLGGGHGLYSLELANKNSDLAITIVDLEKTIQVSQKLYEKEFQARRIRLISGDATNLSSDLGQYDVIMINDLLHSFNYDGKKVILKNCLGHLNEQGIIVISKFPYSAKNNYSNYALFSLKIHMNTGDGYLETNEELETLIASLNCRIEEKYSTYKELYIISRE